MKLPDRLIRVFDYPVDDILAAMPDLSHRAWDANPYRQNTHKIHGQTRSLIFD